MIKIFAKNDRIRIALKNPIVNGMTGVIVSETQVYKDEDSLVVIKHDDARFGYGSYPVKYLNLV